MINTLKYNIVNVFAKFPVWNAIFEHCQFVLSICLQQPSVPQQKEITNTCLMLIIIDCYYYYYYMYIIQRWFPPVLDGHSDRLLAPSQVPVPPPVCPLYGQAHQAQEGLGL